MSTTYLAPTATPGLPYTFLPKDAAEVIVPVMPPMPDTAFDPGECLEDDWRWTEGVVDSSFDYGPQRYTAGKPIAPTSGVKVRPGNPTQNEIAIATATFGWNATDRVFTIWAETLKGLPVGETTYVRIAPIENDRITAHGLTWIIKSIKTTVYKAQYLAYCWCSQLTDESFVDELYTACPSEAKYLFADDWKWTEGVEDAEFQYGPQRYTADMPVAPSSGVKLRPGNPTQQQIALAASSFGYTATDKVFSIWSGTLQGKIVGSESYTRILPVENDKVVVDGVTWLIRWVKTTLYTGQFLVYCQQSQGTEL